MNFVDARQYALEFWTEPELTPFPADVQDTLLASGKADLNRMGAMSVVYNGLLAVDIEYIEAADEILQGIPLDGARTCDELLIVKDLHYLGLFRALIDPEFESSFGKEPKAALKALIEARDRLAGRKSFNAGDAAGAMSEALIIFLLNEAGFKTIPSFPWQDQPYSVDKSEPNPAFDAYVYTEGVTKPRVQVKSSLAMPPSGICEETRMIWGELDAEARREIVVQSYAPDIAVLVLETDFGIAPEYQQKYFKSVMSKATSESRAWMLRAMDVVTDAIW